MDAIKAIAKQHKLIIIEDAAQSIMAKYKGEMLGTLGDLGTYSFHDTKNITSGQGGALLVNTPDYMERAEILSSKGTDRHKFLRKAVDKYTWQDLGSSYALGQIPAALLADQLENAETITKNRMSAWDIYHSALISLENKGLIRRPIIPKHCDINGHMYFILLAPHLNRAKIIHQLALKNIQATFHYIPLHTSPAGEKYGRVSGDMTQTDLLSSTLLRLPLWVGLTPEQQGRIVQELENILKEA